VSESHTDRGDIAALTAELTSLRAENARLLRLLRLTRREAAPPGPAQAGFFEAPPGAVHAGSPPEVKVAFFGALFAARTDALNYIKAARALRVPAGLEVSRSGTGSHTWIFSTGPVPAETARRLGTGLLREAMALRGQMSLASYDRLFPSQDTLPAGGVGNLIAARRASVRHAPAWVPDAGRDGRRCG
jgi:hypothetical protein